jgi:hypothetical protein
MWEWVLGPCAPAATHLFPSFVHKTHPKRALGLVLVELNRCAVDHFPLTR